MTSTLTAKSPGVPHLLILDLGDDLGKGRIVKSTPEGDNLQVLVSGITTLPDGVQVDTRASKGQIYWTCMGVPSLNDGHLMRADADGSNTEIIVKEGITFTPKQLAIDVENEKLYWSDREGMRVMRCSLDGSNVETLICAGSSDDERKDGTRHCVGVAVDVDRSLLYWTQKGPSKGRQGRILRANIDIPAGQTPTTRTDIQTLFANLPEPIDLEIDHGKQLLYWTDRGDPPFGNTLNRTDVSAALDPNLVARGSSKDLILANKLHEAIGLSLDLPGGRAFVADLNGSVYSIDLEGGHKKVLIEDAGTLTGLVYVN